MRLGMIGCGAITRGQHLPAAVANRHVEIAALVDKHLPNAQHLAEEYALSAIVTADYTEILRVNLCGTLGDRQVLVTGGTGFVGGRLVEKLVLERGARVRVLLRNYGTAARIARFPIELVQDDITDADAVQRAVEGCETVFHCAYGNSGSPDERRRINVGGQRTSCRLRYEPTRSAWSM